MGIKQRIALTLPNNSTRTVPDVVAAARQAEALGYDDVWLADTGHLDALTLSAVLLAQTERLRIGIAVVPAYSRTPVVLGATALTLDQISPGRFALGIGSSSKPMMEGWHGLEFRKPLTRVRETVAVLRQVFAGEKTDFDGEQLRSHRYRSDAAPADVPLIVAALRPKMLELAGAVADGVVLNLLPPRGVAKALEHVRRGAEQAGRNPDEIEIICRHQVAIGDDRAAGRELLRRGFVPYFATSVYNPFLAWAGYPEEAEAILAGWQAGDRDATARAFTDEVADAVGVIGTAEECQARIRDYAAAGIHTHIITPLLTDAPGRDETIAAFGRERFRF